MLNKVKREGGQSKVYQLKHSGLKELVLKTAKSHALEESYMSHNY